MLAVFGPLEVQRGCRSLRQGRAGAVGEEELGGSRVFWSILVLHPRSILVWNAQSSLVLDPWRMPG